MAPSSTESTEAWTPFVISVLQGSITGNCNLYVEVDECVEPSEDPTCRNAEKLAASDAGRSPKPAVLTRGRATGRGGAWVAYTMHRPKNWVRGQGAQIDNSPHPNTGSKKGKKKGKKGPGNKKGKTEKHKKGKKKDCMNFYGLVEGTTSASIDPKEAIQKSQTAKFVAVFLSGAAIAGVAVFAVMKRAIRNANGYEDIDQINVPLALVEKPNWAAEQASSDHTQQSFTA